MPSFGERARSGSRSLDGAVHGRVRWGHGRADAAAVGLECLDKLSDVRHTKNICVCCI